MNTGLKKICGGIILVIGIIAFISAISNNDLNFALIYLTAALIFWVLYGLILDAFDVQIFAWIISASGFLVALSIFFMFGIEEVPYPIGAIVFHSGGFAGALGIGLFSLFPILIIHQLDATSVKEKSIIKSELFENKPKQEIFSEEWEIANEDDLQSGEFETR